MVHIERVSFPLCWKYLDINRTVHRILPEAYPIYLDSTFPPLQYETYIWYAMRARTCRAHRIVSADSILLGNHYHLRINYGHGHTGYVVHSCVTTPPALLQALRWHELSICTPRDWILIPEAKPAQRVQQPGSSPSSLSPLPCYLCGENDRSKWAYSDRQTD